MENERKTEISRANADEVLKISLAQLGFRRGVLHEFFKYVESRHKKVLDLTSEVKPALFCLERGIERLRKENLFLWLTVFSRRVADIPSHSEEAPRNEIVSNNRYQVLNNRVLECLSYIRKEDMNEDELRGWLIHHVNFWRNQLDITRVELSMRGENPYSDKIKEVDLFLQILENFTQPKTKTENARA